MKYRLLSHTFRILVGVALPSAALELIQNGSFSDTTGWVRSMNFRMPSDTGARTPPGYAKTPIDSLGNSFFSKASALYQDIVIPPGTAGATLTFWFKIGPNSYSDITRFFYVDAIHYASPTDSTVVRVAELSNLDAWQGYVRFTHVFGSLPAPKMRLRFWHPELGYQGGVTTTFSVDDVSLTDTLPACVYKVSPSSVSLESSPEATLTVTTLNGCAWTAASSESWLGFVGPVSGVGSGTFRVRKVGFIPHASNARVTVADQVYARIAHRGDGCEYSFTETMKSMGPDASNGSFGVLTHPECRWTVRSDANWLLLTSDSTGYGNGVVSYNVTQNTGSTGRIGNIRTSLSFGPTFRLTQHPVCQLTLFPVSDSINGEGGSGSFIGGGTPASCPWQVTTEASWITLSSSVGTGNNSITYTAAPNPTDSPRTATISVGNQTFTLTQKKRPCLTLSASQAGVDYAGGAASVSVTAPAGCSWHARTTTSWLTLGPDSSGSGNGSITYTAAPNPTSMYRVGSLLIGERTFKVAQFGPNCYISEPTPVNAVVASTGGAGSFSISAANSDCHWIGISTVPWVTLTTSDTGSGHVTLGYSVAPNSTDSQRTGSVLVGNKNFPVTQAAPNCPVSLSGDTAMGSAGGTASFVVKNSGTCSWTAGSEAPWLTFTTTPLTGSADATIGYVVAANATDTLRVATVRVGDRSFRVAQTAPICLFSEPIPADTLFGYTGGAGSFKGPVSQSECGWMALSNSPWLTLTTAPTGWGHVLAGYAVAANPTATPRVGAIAFGNRAIRISQSVDPTGLSASGKHVTELRVFTNPSAKNFTVMVPARTGEYLQVRVFDTRGNVVISVSKKLTTDGSRLDLEKPGRGNYFISVQAGNRRMQKRVLFVD